MLFRQKHIWCWTCAIILSLLGCVMLAGPFLHAGDGEPSPTDVAELVTRLRSAAARGDEDVVLECIQSGVDIDDDQRRERGGGVTALALAGKYGHISVMRLLLEHGADLETGHVPPLHAAIVSRQHESVALLVEAGANVNRTCSYGPQPRAFGTAVSSGDVEILELLLQNGLRVDPTSSPDPFLFSVGSADMVGCLVGMGFDVNARRDGDGRALLHRSAFVGDLDMVQALLEHGADMMIRDATGKTALDLARANGHAEVAAYLESLEQ
jgi:ankyrin repeat protein